MQKSEENNFQPGELFAGLNVSSLPDGEIHLWCISINSNTSFLEEYKAALTDSERGRILYYNGKRVQDDFIITQGGLRLLLSGYLDIDPQKIRIGRHAKGKPYTEDDASLCFNISNSGDYVVYAFSRAGEVGIDIEKVRPLPDLDELIEKNFTEKEKRYINGIQNGRVERFFQFWTIKEAYLKAIGEGMRLTPHSLEFSVKSDTFKLDAVNGIFEQEDWLFKVLVPGANHLGTLAYNGNETKIGEMRFV